MAAVAAALARDRKLQAELGKATAARHAARFGGDSDSEGEGRGRGAAGSGRGGGRGVGRAQGPGSANPYAPEGAAAPATALPAGPWDEDEEGRDGEGEAGPAGVVEFGGDYGGSGSGGAAAKKRKTKKERLRKEGQGGGGGCRRLERGGQRAFHAWRVACAALILPLACHTLRKHRGRTLPATAEQATPKLRPSHALGSSLGS